MQSLHSAITPAHLPFLARSPPWSPLLHLPCTRPSTTPPILQLSDFPTSRKVEKPTNRKVGKLAPTTGRGSTTPPNAAKTSHPHLPRRANRPPAPSSSSLHPPCIRCARPQPHPHPHPANSPSLQLPDKSKSRQVGKLASWQTLPPSPAPPTRAGCPSFLSYPAGKPMPARPALAHLYPAALLLRPALALPGGKPKTHPRRSPPKLTPPPFHPLAPHPVLETTA